MAKVTFFNRYSSKPITEGTSFIGQEEVCNQQMAEECEISKLLNQYAEGQISQLPVVRESVYNDVMITPKSYEDAQNLINKVKDDFYTLPKETQRQFGSIENYVKDLSLISQGHPETIAKYSNFSTSPILSDVNNSSSSGISSSSISRGDSEIGSTDVNTNNTNSFAGKES